VLFVALAGTVLALPNLVSDPSVLIAREDGASILESELTAIAGRAGQAAGIVAGDDGTVTLRFETVAARRDAAERLGAALPDHIVTYTTEPRFAWLRSLGLRPVSLGLDLRGGVHFTYEVNLDAVSDRLIGDMAGGIERRLRAARVGATTSVSGETLTVLVPELPDATTAREAIEAALNAADARAFDVTETRSSDAVTFVLALREDVVTAQQSEAMVQNLITLRNRVNELGLSEPVVVSQGNDRIMVQIPGAGDPAQVRRILSSTATIAWHLEDTENDAIAAARRDRAPPGTLLRTETDGTPILLQSPVIATGNELTDASFGYVEGQPGVTVRLNAAAAERMLETTQRNVGRPLAVLLIEDSLEAGATQSEPAERVRRESVIFVGRIDNVFSNTFRLTGLPARQAQDMAVLLRSGALAVPIYEVPPAREVSPTLGEDNIRRGRNALMAGFLLVVAFMAAYYRLFGLIANFALLLNVVLIFGLLSLLGAVLTLPGLAGIVLTIGMAVDANVLIFERIRECSRNGESPLASIRHGYDAAFSTIADANVTTLIAAIVLFMFGTSPIKGFAITLSLGIVTSMFTAIVATRAIVDAIYAGRRPMALSIGMGRHAKPDG
jgi:preprotein translocase subunit SecD